MKQMHKLFAVSVFIFGAWLAFGLSKASAQDVTPEPAVIATEEAAVEVPNTAPVIVVNAPAAEDGGSELYVIATIVIGAVLGIIAIVRGQGKPESNEQFLANLERQTAYFERRFNDSDAKVQTLIRTIDSLARAATPWTPGKDDDRFSKWLQEVTDGIEAKSKTPPTPPAL